MKKQLIKTKERKKEKNNQKRIREKRGMLRDEKCQHNSNI